MGWDVSGTGNNLRFSLSNSATTEISGVTSNHYPKPQSGDFVDDDVLERLRSAECEWNIHKSDELDPPSDIHYVGRSEDHEKLRESPNQVVSAIKFVRGNDRSKDGVWFTVVLPPLLFERTAELLRLVLMDDRLEYSFTFDFFGFAQPGVKAEFPTVSDFMSGEWDSRAYISNEFSMQVRRIS